MSLVADWVFSTTDLGGDSIDSWVHKLNAVSLNRELTSGADEIFLE